MNRYITKESYYFSRLFTIVMALGLGPTASQADGREFSMSFSVRKSAHFNLMTCVKLPVRTGPAWKLKPSHFLEPSGGTYLGWMIC